jgi:hypothetical protein
MSDVSQKAVTLVQGLNKDLWGKVRNLPQSVKTMVWMHLTAPWIPNFAAFVIVPLREGLDRYLGQPVVQFGAETWYYPSLDWWMAHSDTSHPPAGSGCSEAAHIAFLTREGESAEFAYAAILKDGTIGIAGPGDFYEECAFWSSGAR